MTDRASQDELLSVEEVADLLKLSRRWVYDAARRQHIPSAKIGKYLRFRRRDVLAFIEARFDDVS